LWPPSCTPNIAPPFAWLSSFLDPGIASRYGRKTPHFVIELDERVTIIWEADNRWRVAPPVVVELAREQKFKCAFCDKAKGLIIEHDHWPERDSGDKLTIYNVRGLACSGCNWHLGTYEADERGDYRGFDDAYKADSRSSLM
jgi:hypothetical protein